MANIYGRQVVLPLANKSGGGVIAGDVVIIDTSNDGAFTTTTTGQYQGSVGVAQETIANNATGRVLVSGYATLVNVPSSMTRGRFLETHTVVKQATQNTTRRAGSFGQFLTGGTTPTAWLWGFPDNAGAAGGSAGTPALTFGTSAAAGAASSFVATDATLPIFDATVPVTQAFADAAATGSAAFAARRDHKHGMPTLTASTGDSTADVTLTADTIADVTGCSLSLAAGTWLLIGNVIFQGSSATYDYTLGAITDSSNVVLHENRGQVNNAGPIGMGLVAFVTPGSTTTYKLRGQSGRTGNKTLRYSSGTQIGSRLVALRVA